MDLITQGLLGATTARSTITPERQMESRSATLIGFASGMLADADILIQSTQDPLLNLDYHRHFSHSLIFIPMGALLAAALLWPLFRRRLPFRRLYLYSLAGYLFSGLLDACTGYGTHLYWPFSQSRVAWNLVSVVDPIFSGLLLAGLLAALIWQHKTIFTRGALLLCAVYLGLAALQQQRVLENARDVATRRGQTALRLIARPSFANIVVWRTVYITNESQPQIHVDAHRAGPAGIQLYAGAVLPHFDTHAARQYLAKRGVAENTVFANDIERFRTFSEDYLAIHPDRPEILGDIRFSMLPDSALPMWGLVLDATRADQHAEWRAFRELPEIERERFVRMLLGQAL